MYKSSSSLLYHPNTIPSPSSHNSQSVHAPRKGNNVLSLFIDFILVLSSMDCPYTLGPKSVTMKAHCYHPGSVYQLGIMVRSSGRTPFIEKVPCPFSSQYPSRGTMLFDDKGEMFDRSILLLFLPSIIYGHV